MKRLSFSNVLSALVAGFIFGSAEPVFSATTSVPVGVSQEEPVLYALTLIDADTEDRLTETSERAQVCLTVSVPRTGTTGIAPTLRAIPATLMYRPHGGEGSAWSGAIYLTAEDSGYYPMPQQGDINRDVVSSGASIPDTLKTLTVGTVRDPARWERRFYSNVLTIDRDNPGNMNPLLDSLINGHATYEWYAASRYGLGLFTIVSDIQDHGRKMDFTDPRIWRGVSIDDDTKKVWSDSYFGGEKYNAYTLDSMAISGTSWELKKVALGSAGSNIADEGALLLNDETITLDDIKNGSQTAGEDPFEACSMIVSPTYPDGISKVVFKTKISTDATESPQYLYVQVKGVGNNWTAEGVSVKGANGNFVKQDLGNPAATLITPTQNLTSITVKMDEETAGVAGAGTQFRILRVTSYGSEVTIDDPYATTILIRELRVSSATPMATIGAPEIRDDDANLIGAACNIYDADKNEGERYTVNFKVIPSANRMPRGYEASLGLSRRADSDGACGTYYAAIDASNDSLVVSFIGVDSTRLSKNALGAFTNVAENSFCRDEKGNVVSLLPGVYNLTLDCKLLGSFEAGRDVLDKREQTTLLVKDLPVDENDSAKGSYPLTLEVRELPTNATQIDMVLTYRTRAGESFGYVMNNTEVNFIPDGREERSWYAMLPKEIAVSAEGNIIHSGDTEKKDPDAIYAWVADATDGDAEYHLNLVNFRVRVRQPNGNEYWYGQNETVVQGGMPTTLPAYPGSTISLTNGEILTAGKTPEEIVPILVDISELSATHLCVTFKEPEDIATQAGTLSVCGANEQDFNTWDAASNGLFDDTEFHENVKSAVADFDAIISGDGKISRGWIPDQGPLATTSEITDHFTVGRAYGDNKQSSGDIGISYQFFVGDLASIAADYFASWGASSEPASHKYLREDEDDSRTWTEGFEFGSSYGNQVVLKLDANSMIETPSGFQPDAMVRLSGNATIKQSTDARSDISLLKGIGEVRFKLSRSEPYAINRIVFCSDSSKTFKGVGTTISINDKTKSGYSTSLYLCNVGLTSTYYELRLSQIFIYQDGRERPQERVVMELWQWTGGIATRKSFEVDNGTTDYHVTNQDSMQNKEARLWIDDAGFLNASFANKTIKSTSTVSPTTLTHIAFGSAECWPIFNSIVYMNATNGAFEGLTYTPDTTKVELLTSDAKWIVNSASGSQLQLQRGKRPADTSAQVRLDGYSASAGKSEQLAVFTAGDTEQEYSITVGRADLSLSLVATDGNEVFIDDLTVSSWQGDDTNRNGTKVPLYTNTHWNESETDGFSAVGVWVQPVDESQNSALPTEYTGEQCLLMQYSRRNTSAGLSAGTTNNIHHTASSLALYTPYSSDNFGTISFRYRIPLQSEFKDNVQNPSVSLLLQYTNARSSHTDNLNDSYPLSSWENVSTEIELPITNGEWRTMSITPRLLENSKYVSMERGILRLVMVSPIDSTDDPYVYLDDFRITSSSGEVALWSAGNIRLSEEPIASLYWKDRLAKNINEKTFAWKSRLTRAVLFNDHITEDVVGGVENPLPQSYVESPILEKGAGIINFAARLDEPSLENHYVYVYGYESETIDPQKSLNFPDDYTYLTRIKIEDTLYRQYNVDVTKTIPNYKSLKRIRLQVPVEGGVVDGRNGVPQVEAYGRIWLDKLSITEPIAPSVRLSNVCFSTLPGDNFEKHTKVLEGASGIFDVADGRNSPLSQPLAGSPLAVKVTVDRLQQVKKDSIKVFFTWDIPTEMKRVTSDYSYLNALDTRVEAATTPIYTWDPSIETNVIISENLGETKLSYENAAGELNKWGLDAWFATKRTAIEDTFMRLDAAENKANYDALTASGLESLTSLQGNTILLTRQGEPSEKQTFTTTSNDADKFDEIKELKANALVRYAVWAIFETEDSTADHPRYGYSIIDASSYTDFPWYFPRNLNTEMRTRYNELASNAENAGVGAFDTKGSSFFTPYFWLYDTVPGEVFINEFNMNDASSTLMKRFIEFCTPAKNTMDGWYADISDLNLLSTVETFAIKDEGSPLVPDPGAVPAQGGSTPLSNRTFYTIINASSNLLANNENVTSEPHKNAGRAQTGLYSGYERTNSAAVALRLYRPTGGAEHIVLYSLWQDGQGSSVNAESRLDALATKYRTAYKQEGFGTEWFQSFREEDWESSTNNPDANYKPADHARRLAVVKTFKTNADGVYDKNGTTDSFIGDARTSNKSRVNSIATIDMGGAWVMRTNADTPLGTENEAKGQLDVSHLFTSPFNMTLNLVEQARPGDTKKEVQVTPRQINLDQWLIYYADPNGNTISSQVTGLGQHMVDFLDANDISTTTIFGGRDMIYRTIPDGSKVQVTYKAFPFNKLETVTLTATSTGDGVAVEMEDELKSLIVEDATAFSVTYAPNPNQPNMMIATFTPKSEEGMVLQLKPELSDGTKYSFTVSASYTVAPEGAKDIITEVSPFCGDALTGDAKYQPWCGSAFGFSVKYDTAALAAKNARLVGAIITYPTPNQLGGADWMGLNPVSVGGNEIPAFTGLTFDQAKLAMNQLGEAGYLRSAALDLTRKVDDSVSEIYSPTCVTVLGDSYMVADSNGVIVKEPKIPYLAWGIYAVTVQSGATTETVQYLIPQDISTPRYAWPKWYAPLPQEGTIPYFYLYSTPPESVWLNEVNLVKGAGNDAFVEVVIPKLRQGILDAGVPQITTDGWKVQYTVPGGTATDWVDLSDAQVLDAISSFSYKFVAKTATDVGKDAVAVALIRPCGAGEGGVWTGVTANGGSSIPATTDVSATLGHYIVEGQTDASNTAGSIQLVGGTTTDEFGDILRETRAERTLWRFVASETNGTENEGANGDVGLDSNPEWNRIRVTSTLLNTVYGGSPCGWQAFGYVPTETTVIGATAEESFAANSWVSDITKNHIQRVITYRPRVGYTYDYLTLPAEWMGKVLLVGKRLAKGEEFSQGDLLMLARETYYRAETATTDAEKARIYVELGGFATAEVAGDAFTGRIIFNGDAVVDETSGLLFQDTDDYVVAVLLIAEPASATNNLVMAMRPGSIEFGAWLVSQSFYGLDSTGAPDLTKGGEVATNPIWDDEIGNGEGEHLDKHGWIYQPLIGDTLSMSAVIRPDNGLYARETIIEEMTSEKPTVVPMLVWALTDKNKVPSDLFTGAASQSATTFLANWDISKLFGAMPAIGDGVTADFKKLRSNLQLANSGKSMSLPYVKGGILPMTLQGIRGSIDDQVETEDFEKKTSLTLQEVEALKKDSEAPYLAFRVMTNDELTAALNAGDPSTTDDDGALAMIQNEDSLVPLTATLSMKNAENESVWSEGAILRFAVVLVDVTTGEIIDCQGVSNFSSDNLPVYCPWYVPEERADVNYVATSQKAGVAPYAWVYSIGYNDVWINEIRPFHTDSYGSAIELAMRATTVTEVDFGSKKLYRPAQSLDGWKIVVKYAPMPDVTTMDAKTKLNWTRSTDVLATNHPLYNRTIELKSWIPGKRIVSTDASADSIDYYAIATSHNEITNLKFDEAYNPLTADLARLDYATCLKQSGEYVDDGSGTGTLVPAMDVDQFVYLKTPTIPVELLTEENGTKTKFGDSAALGTMEIFPNYDALVKYLNSELGVDYAKDGLVFGIELVRNNGVVADEILFSYKNESAVDSLGEMLTLDARLSEITTLETQSFASSNIIRYVNTAIGGLTGNTSILFVDVYEKDATTNTLTAIQGQQGVWYPMDYSMSSGISTIPGPNNNTSATFSDAYFKQPYSSMSLDEFIAFISRTYRISASYMGGTLGLNALEAKMPTPTFDLARVYKDAEGNDILTALKTRASMFTVSNLPKDTRYRLTLEPIADEWFDVDVTLSNAAAGQVEVATDLVTTLNSTQKTMTLKRYCIDFDPSKDNSLGLRSLSTTYDAAVLNADKNYVVMLVPNKEAQKIIVKLKDAAPQDAGYEAWLIASGSPAEVAQAMDNDSVDLAEKYWLGFDDALTDNGDNVSLSFSAFGIIENNAEKSVQASVTLMNGATEIKQLYADGALVLVGKETLSDPAWYFVQTLDVASDVNTSGGAPRILNIATDCKYFQVVLMSQEDVKKLERKK